MWRICIESAGFEANCGVEELLQYTNNELGTSQARHVSVSAGCLSDVTGRNNFHIIQQ